MKTGAFREESCTQLPLGQLEEFILRTLNKSCTTSARGYLSLAKIRHSDWMWVHLLKLKSALITDNTVIITVIILYMECFSSQPTFASVTFATGKAVTELGRAPWEPSPAAL